MRPSHCSYMIFITILCVMLLNTAQSSALADDSRSEIIALYSRLYGPENAEQLYEEGRVAKAVQGFTQRINFRDVISLTGKMEGDPQDHTEVLSDLNGGGISVGSPARNDAGYSHLGSPQRRHYITTSKQAYSEDTRKKLRADLLEMFLAMPPNVRMNFKTERFFVSGSTATVHLRYNFRALEYETNKTRRLTSQPPAQMILRLRKEHDRWLVENFEEIAQQLVLVVGKR